MGKDTQKSQAQGKDMSKDAPKAAQSPATDSKSQMSQDKDGAKSGSTVGAAPSGAVNLTTEQRTTIRSEVLTSSAPRVDQHQLLGQRRHGGAVQRPRG